MFEVGWPREEKYRFNSLYNKNIYENKINTSSLQVLV